MKKFIRTGVDLGKNSFQIHALGDEEGQAVARKLSRQAMRRFFCEIEPCRIGMEACASSHYWARQLNKLGHDVLLIPSAYTKPYVKRGPRMMRPMRRRSARRCRGEAERFVPVKSTENQAALMLHKARELLIKQRTSDASMRLARPSCGVWHHRRQGDRPPRRAP
jgi:transposase